MEAHKFYCAVLIIVMFFAGVAVGNTQSRMVMQECEKPLPRNQHCTLTATPPPQPAEGE